MFHSSSAGFNYIPILAIRPAEMNALEQLPEKDKDLMLPLFPLAGWVASNMLDKSFERIAKAFNNRSWIGDIDACFLSENEDYRKGDNYPRPVFKEIELLLSSGGGYQNWVQYVAKTPNLIPAVQLEDTSQLEKQLIALNALGRGLVFRFGIADLSLNDNGSGRYLNILASAARLDLGQVLIVLDFGVMNAEVMQSEDAIRGYIENVAAVFPAAIIAISGSSFPGTFSGQTAGENSIYERHLYNRLRKQLPTVRLIYSDRGGARAEPLGGGSGLPAPRIDYPLADEWKFIRREFVSGAPDEKKALYTEAARAMVSAPYWNKALAIWGTQLIELTSLGDDFGINSALKSTAARLNIHMHQQLHYGNLGSLLDTDEAWED